MQAWKCMVYHIFSFTVYLILEFNTYFIDIGMKQKTPTNLKPLILS